MLSHNFLEFAIIFFYISERLLELGVNQINRKILISKYRALLRYPGESLQMKLFHTVWFIALIIESLIHGEIAGGVGIYIAGAVLLFAQVLRWYAIVSLGQFWSVDIYEMSEHPIIDTGPYSYIKHPNYLAVMLEFLFVPYILGCPFTLVAGFIVNSLILKRRIDLEERALDEQSMARPNLSYKNRFHNKNKFLIKLNKSNQHLYQ